MVVQVIALVHTLLYHSRRAQLGLRTCLILAPLNVVLNWVSEWTKWVDAKHRAKVSLLHGAVCVAGTTSYCFRFKLHSS